MLSLVEYTWTKWIKYKSSLKCKQTEIVFHSLQVIHGKLQFTLNSSDEKEEAPTQQFDVGAQLHEFRAESKDVRDVRERQHEQRFFQLAAEGNEG